MCTCCRGLVVTLDMAMGRTQHQETRHEREGQEGILQVHRPGLRASQCESLSVSVSVSLSLCLCNYVPVRTRRPVLSRFNLLGFLCNVPTEGL